MKIGIDMGHCISGFDLGARGCNLKEEALTRELGIKIMDKLKSLGHTVINCSKETSSSVNDSLSYRVKKANENNVDLFISIHFNAGGGTGTEIYTYNGEKYVEAQNILNNMGKLGFKNRGIKDGSWIYVIKNSNCKSMLIEVCFIDNIKDISAYKSNGYNKIADSIIEGLGLGSRKYSYKKENVNSSNNLIKKLQHALNIQFNLKLAEDGILGLKTLNSLVTIKKGDSGDVVKFIQEVLLQKGYSVGSTGADGGFGENTRKAVVNFQKNNGLLQDGIVGKNTWRRLLGLS